MVFHSLLKKRITEIHTPVNYFLDCEGDVLLVHDCIGRKISLVLKGTSACIATTTNPFSDRVLTILLLKFPQAADWVMRPELSKAHLDIEDRDLIYRKKFNCKLILPIWH